MKTKTIEEKTDKSILVFIKHAGAIVPYSESKTMYCDFAETKKRDAGPQLVRVCPPLPGGGRGPKERIVLIHVGASTTKLRL